MAVERRQHSEAYQFADERNHQFLSELREDLLTFGHGFPASQGGAYCLNAVGHPDLKQGIHTWITARMAHVYALGELDGHRGSAQLVDSALSGLSGILHDQTHGGWYSALTASGKAQSDKVCYAHAFVMLATASAMLTGHASARGLLDEAINIFMEAFWDDTEGMAVDSWDMAFTHVDSYRGINANMHTVEAFLALADVLHEEEWRERAGRIITRVLAWASENTWRIPEHFTSNWEPLLEFNVDRKEDQFKPYGATPGHGIEWSRLIVQYALSSESIAERDRKELIESSQHLFNRAVKDAWGTAKDDHPGLSYTTDWVGKTVVGDRMHWTLAEGVNAAATLYMVTEQEEYADWYRRFWQYIDEYMVDHIHGSWFHQLNAENQVIGTVWPGKPDLYHAVQATLIPQLNPAQSVVPAFRTHLELLSL
jgi:mannose/cellobiose epimerase-like protein (N-acyl-D-glucosamine 2-epimerase family)